MLMVYGDYCTDIMSELLLDMETEEEQMMNSEFYRYVGSVV